MKQTDIVHRRTIKDINQNQLKKLLKYFPKTGNWKWKIDKGKMKKGMYAGCFSPDGYTYIIIDRKRYKASRLAFLYVKGYFPEHNVDHINRIRWDDRWYNLREVTQQCNIRNCGLLKNNTSGITGVCWNKKCKKWQVNIKVNQKNKYIGVYKNKKLAAFARLKAEKKYNWSNCNSTSSAYLWLKKRKMI